MNRLLGIIFVFCLGISCSHSEEIITDTFLEEQLSKVEVKKPEVAKTFDFAWRQDAQSHTSAQRQRGPKCRTLQSCTKAATRRLRRNWDIHMRWG